MANEMQQARESFIGIKVEGTPGSDPGAFVAGDLVVRVMSDPSYALNPDVHEVDSLGDDYFQSTLLGAVRGTMGFQTLLQGTGSSTVTTVPAFALALKLAGMQATNCETIAHGGTTGTPIPGETFTQASTSATAVFIRNNSGDTAAFVQTISGAEDDSNVWTGGVSGATFTPSAVGADYGCVIFPDNTPSTYKVGWTSRTLGSATDGETQFLLGCLGGWSLSHASIGAPGLFDISVNGRPAAAAQEQFASIPAVTYDAGDVAGFRGAAFVCGDATAANLLVNTLTISSGHSSATPANANATDNIGTVTALPQGRRFTASFDPLMVPTASYSYAAKMIAGISGEMYYTIGSGAGNIIEVCAPKPVYTGLSSVIRDGARGQSMNLSLDTTSGAINNEIYIITR